MRYLTLNTHSWMEANPLEKLDSLVQYIIEKKIDRIALQEVNQLMDADEVDPGEYFHQPKGHPSIIRADNYGYLLIKKLKEHGLDYHWSWTCSHIGYDIYEEGSAILAKQRFDAHSLVVSPMDDRLNYRTRRLIVATFKQSSQDFRVVSCHFSWWSEDSAQGFFYEWYQLSEFLEREKMPTILLGDFNSPASRQNEGYQLVMNSFKDAFLLADTVNGEFTVDKVIDGWSGNTDKLRIDFGFFSQEEKVSLYEVVFDGRQTPIVSDHFGVMIETK